MTGPGHNSVAADHLRSFVERVERVEEEIKALNDDKRDIYAEAKASGFDVKVLKQVIRIRKQDADERAEQETILDLYLAALGMIPGGEGEGESSSAPREAAKPSRVHVHAREPAPAHDPETGEIHEHTPASAPEPAMPPEERRAEEAVAAVAAEASDASADDPTNAGSAGREQPQPIARQITVNSNNSAAPAVDGKTGNPRGPIQYPRDAQGNEDAGDIPDFLRRA